MNLRLFATLAVAMMVTGCSVTINPLGAGAIQYQGNRAAVGASFGQPSVVQVVPGVQYVPIVPPPPVWYPVQQGSWPQINCPTLYTPGHGWARCQ